jgi:CO/xanthine dehydrogenase Mo-binding subunit
MTGPYRIPNVLVESYSVNTNTLNPGHCRAPGGPESTFAFDSQMDIIARRLRMDPLEIRLKNLVEEGDSVFGAEKLPKNAWRQALLAAVEKAGWGKKEKKPYHGMGVACGHWPGYSGLSNVVVSVHEGGSVKILSGAIDLTGTDTTFAQIAAEVLSVDLEDVTVTFADTDTALPAEGTWGSRTTYMMGSVVKRAAEEARAQLLRAAADDFGVSLDKLELADGKVRVKGNPSRSKTIAEVATWAQTTTGTIVGKASLADLPMQPVLCACVVELHVDPETGQITVDKMTIAADVGFAINPLEVEGQMEGGAAMGMAYGLLEEYLYDKDGKMLNPNWLDFRQPTALDTSKIDPIIVEEPTDTGPFGAKHIAEPPIIPVAAAIANAIEDATGVRVKEIPITPERLLKALKKQGEKQQAAPVGAGTPQ